MQRAYVKYPPEGKRPPNFEELQALLKEQRQNK